MIKINNKEVTGIMYEANVMKKQVHFLDFSSLLSNIFRFIRIYAKQYASIEAKVRSISKKMIEELNIHLKIHGVNIEFLSGCDTKTESNSRTFLKVNDPNSLGYILKVVDGRMLVKVDRFESKKKLEVFVLSQKDNSTLGKHYFDDFSSFVNYEAHNLKTVGYRDNELKKTLNICDEFKAREWTKAFKKVNVGKKFGIVSAALSIVSSLENLQGTDKNFDIGDIKEFVVDSGISNGLIHKKNIDSLFLIPVGTIVGTTIKEGLNVLNDREKFIRKKVSVNYNEDDLIFEKNVYISNSVGSTINRMFW